MRLEKFKELYETCKTLPNYQFRDMSDEEFLAKATKSFDKLPNFQKEKVVQSWAKKLSKEGITPESLEAARHDLYRYRFMAQTNLFFLCHLLELYGQTTVLTHEEICNKFFVQKDPTFLTFDQFADQYTDLKQRMLLVPRGGFKSSIDMADCVQWIICFPTITVAILTGVLQLAKDFVGEVKQHFTYVESGTDSKGKAQYDVRQIMDKQTGEWSDSLFQVLFPEHCLSPLEGNQLEFQTPAAEEMKEPSVRAASIDQALSGSHYNILKLDDVVTNENTKTEARIKDTIKQISIDNGLLNPNGFYDVIGTWYDERDYYGVTIKKIEQRAKLEGSPESIKGSVDSGRFNAELGFKLYLRAAWWPTAAAAKSGKIEEEMTKGDWELWFPERLSYEFLLSKQKDDSDLDEEGDTGYFAIKYLNNPRKVNRVKFPRELLVRRTIPHHQFPGQGIVVTTVDTAYSVKSWADYTVIITALIFGGRFYIINMVRGRFNEYDLPKVIANVANKWKPKRIAIEDSVGVKWMGRELRREMDSLKISIPVEFVSLGLGSKLRSKQLKAKPVLRLLGDERMYFLNSCEGLEEIYNELEKFTGTSDDLHDDIVSALSLLVEQFIGYADTDNRGTNAIQSEFVSNQQAKALHDMVYCLGKYAKFNEAGLVDENPVTQFQAQQIAQQVQEPYVDPLNDLFH
jgi:phage terminase large subunit-like protein